MILIGLQKKRLDFIDFFIFCGFSYVPHTLLRAFFFFSHAFRILGVAKNKIPPIDLRSGLYLILFVFIIQKY